MAGALVPHLPQGDGMNFELVGSSIFSVTLWRVVRAMCMPVDDGAVAHIEAIASLVWAGWSLATSPLVGLLVGFPQSWRWISARCFRASFRMSPWMVVRVSWAGMVSVGGVHFVLLKV